MIDINSRWKPFAIALLVIVFIVGIQQIYWISKIDIDSREVWDSKEIEHNIEGTTESWSINYNYNNDTETILKGSIDTPPCFEVYTNETIEIGVFSETDGIVYTESLYGKTKLVIDGLPITVNGDLCNEFKQGEIVYVSAKLNESVVVTEDNVTVYQGSWEAESIDVKLSSHIDRWFYLIELFVFIIGIYLTIEKYPHRNKVWKDTWNIAKFEFNSEIKTNRTMILIIFFTLFITGMGWLLGDLQKEGSPILGSVQTPEDAITRLSWFTFFVVSLAAIAVSSDNIYKEKQSNTISLLLSRPVSKESIILGKGIGLTGAIGAPAFIAMFIGLILMIKGGETPRILAIGGYMILGLLMILTIVFLQLCFSIISRSGAESVVYGLGVWLLLTLVWSLIILAAAFVLGIDVTTENFEHNEEYQSVVAKMGLFNPGIVYQFGVGLAGERTLSVDLEGVSGWMVIWAIIFWPMFYWRLAVWLFKEERYL
tara:strand:+ start:42568 stop:44016 length:1449 start_codon:yes stop_codon:yes gene_type:complete